MANVNPFDYKIDKITEREVVYDFISRLSTGKEFVNQDYNQATNSDDKQIIFPAGYMVKDEVLMNMIRTMDISDIHHLDKIKTAYKTINPGARSVMIMIPNNCTLYRIVQEKTGQDVTQCFIKSDNAYIANFDVPTTIKDTYKAYFYTS